MKNADSYWSKGKLLVQKRKQDSDEWVDVIRTDEQKVADTVRFGLREARWQVQIIEATP